jgi:glycosyltransferase involved in cell wall biosynthesis
MSCKKDILYLGTLVPNSEFNKLLLLDNTPQIATHLFCWKIFSAIINLNNDNFYVISTRPITEYPNCRIKINTNKKWLHSNILLHELFFINLPIFKTFSIFISSFFYSISWLLRTKSQNRKCIILDNYQLPYLLTGLIVSTLCKIPIICVLTDPPNMIYKIKWEPVIKKYFRFLNSKLSLYFLEKLDGVIAITNILAKEFCPKSKSLIIEAIGEGNLNIKSKYNSKFIIMYSGGLSSEYGIINFLEAFVEVDNHNLELWFYGKGDAEIIIKEYEKKDTRIFYKGCLRNEEIKKIQTEVSLLINPRPIDLPDGNYSFPSKILEYLESGTPVLVTKLKGIPNEYFEHLLFLDSLKKEDIIKKIIEIYSMDKEELQNFGLSGKLFSNQKNIENQGKKIVHFINSLK